MSRIVHHDGLLRARDGHARVSNVELFFDLVFVFAVTQLSHTLLETGGLDGALRVLFLFFAVWWVWICTAWVTNWLDPDRTAARLTMFILMLAGLVLSTSIPKAFGDQGLAFAAAYAFSQVFRSVFMVWAIGDASPGNRRNFQRIAAWFAFSGVLWIAGGMADGPARLTLWIAALALEYSAPSFGFHVPGLGRSTTADWDVDGGHMAERCGLFIIIALGESLLVTGATFGQLAWTPVNLSAFALASIGSAAMWWIYFDTGAERGSKQIIKSGDPGRLARLAYTYIHPLIVAGIIVAAVADELLLAHPLGHSEPKAVAAMLGGPALYLVGNTLFKRVIVGRLPLSHLIGLALLAALTPAASSLSPLALTAAATAVLILVAVWEAMSLHDKRRRPAL